MNTQTKYRLLRVNTLNNKIIELDRYNCETWQQVIYDFINSDFACLCCDLDNFSEWSIQALKNPIETVQKINRTVYGKYRYIFTRDSELLDFLFEIGQFDPFR